MALSNKALGLEEIPKPSYVCLENQYEAYELLNKAKNILIHTDVDMDGFMGGYIMIKWLAYTNKKPCGVMLNSGKRHGAAGIDKERVGGADLLVILDSSCNELRQIVEDTETNVLIIDHHEIEENAELRVEHNGKIGLVVNNMTSGDEAFSAGLLVYEFIRARSMYDEQLVSNLMLYQNATVSLITDSIKMDNPRNLWYANKTFREDNEVETNLGKVLNAITKYDNTLNKSVVIFNIAPVFNKAIRAYRGDVAMSCLFKKPELVTELLRYGEIQEHFINLAMSCEFDASKKYIIADIGVLGIPDTYCGVIASKLVEEHQKSVICLVGNKGSFRGYSQDDSARYLEWFKETNCNINVKGHQRAFGIEGTLEEIDRAFSIVVQREKEAAPKVAIALGNVGLTGWLGNAKNEEEWVQLKRKGALVNLARANGIVSVQEQEYIVVPRSDVKCIGSFEKYSRYESWGMEFISMKLLENSGYVKIYAEDNGMEIKFFARK